MRRHFFIPLICISLFLGSAGMAYADNEAGRILTVRNKVYVVRHDKKSKAERQMPLMLKDAIETDKGSRTKLFFNDDSILNVGELSRVEVEEYLYNPEKKRSKSVYRLLEGSLKVIVGRSDLEIHTPTAVAAARGTKFIIWLVYEDEDTEVSELQSDDSPPVLIASAGDVYIGDQQGKDMLISEGEGIAAYLAGFGFSSDMGQMNKKLIVQRRGGKLPVTHIAVLEGSVDFSNIKGVQKVLKGMQSSAGLRTAPRTPAPIKKEAIKTVSGQTSGTGDTTGGQKKLPVKTVKIKKVTKPKIPIVKPPDVPKPQPELPAVPEHDDHECP